jgi:hypothetical protein
MRSMTFIFSAVLCGATAVSTYARSEPDVIDQFLAVYMTNVVVVRQLPHASGELISCVSIDHQPAMNQPRFPSRRPELAPECLD